MEAYEHGLSIINESFAAKRLVPLQRGVIP
jgi:hypothetical protein